MRHGLGVLTVAPLAPMLLVVACGGDSPGDASAPDATAPLADASRIVDAAPPPTRDAGLDAITTYGAGGDCAYNGGSHTQPFFYVSSLLIGFR